MKRVLETALVAGGMPAIHHWLRARAGESLVLAYHNVVADADAARGDASLHLSLADFRAQLDAIERAATVVPLGHVAAVPARATTRIAITFDDAYVGAMTLAARELEARGMPFTVFVAPDLLGQTPWWDVLARELPGGLTPEARDHCLMQLQGDGATILQHFGLESALPEQGERRIATEADLHRVAKHSGATFASHSWSHVNLARIDAAKLAGELVESKRWVEQRFANVLPVLSYPYGLYDAEVKRVAARAGYERCFRVAGGWGRGDVVDPFSHPRLNVPAGVSVAGFRIRCAL